MKRLWPFLLAVVLFVVLVLGTVWRSYADRLPGAARMCEAGFGVAGGASCQLAVTTRDSVAKLASEEATFRITAYDPISRTDLAFDCERGEVIRCEASGGQVVVIAR